MHGGPQDERQLTTAYPCTLTINLMRASYSSQSGRTPKESLAAAQAFEYASV